MTNPRTSGVSLNPEAELLFCCARTDIDAKGAWQIKQLLQLEVDWEHLLDWACEHRMLPLLYWHLSKICPEAVPKPIFRQLRGGFNANAKHNMLLNGELLKIMKLFKAAGIRALPYKGPVLTTIVYRNFGLRPCGDLDILVHKEDLLSAEELLQTLGYCSEFHPEYASRLVRSDGLAIVELHTKLSPKEFSLPLDFKHLWKDRVQVSVAGTNIPSVAPKDLLIILCEHGSRHLWERLSWICDVAEHLRAHQEIDFRQLISHARKLGRKRMLLLGLFLANDLLKASLPEDVLLKIERDKMVKLLATYVERWLFSEEKELPKGFGESKIPLNERDRFNLKVRERLRDKVRYYFHIYEVAPNEKDIAFVRLPKSLFFLYYLIRPLRLVITYGLGL